MAHPSGPGLSRPGRSDTVRLAIVGDHEMRPTWVERLLLRFDYPSHPLTLGNLQLSGWDHDVTIIDQHPWPQAVVVGFADWEPPHGLLPNIDKSNDISLSDRRRVEWDVLVVKGVRLKSVPHHMLTLAFDCGLYGTATATNGSPQIVDTKVDQLGAAMTIPDGLPADLVELIKSDLVPKFRGMARKPYLTRRGFNSAGAVPVRRETLTDLIPLLLDADKNVMAGIFKTYPSIEKRQGWCVAIPCSVKVPDRWLAACIRLWNEWYPERIPVGQPWRTLPKWMTAEERSLELEAEALSQRHEALLEEVKREQTDLAERTREATRRADVGLRGLLSEQGDDLVSLVEAALRELGFSVHNCDENLPDGVAKHEDLRIEREGQHVLVEVKGYGAGAKQRDLGVIQQYAVSYAVQTGQAPAGLWYVVNHHRMRDPDLRPPTLEGAGESIEVFSRTNGLILPTPELFLLVQAVRGGCVSREAAQQMLQDQRGVFRLETTDQSK